MAVPSGSLGGSKPAPVIVAEPKPGPQPGDDVAVGKPGERDLWAKDRGSLWGRNLYRDRGPFADPVHW